MIEIVPAIIPYDLVDIKEKFSKVLGAVKKVQLDVVDGEYASNKTWPFTDRGSEELIKIVRGEENFPYAENFILEIDMLVFHPIEYLSDFISLGAKSFVVHVDSTDHLRQCIETVKNIGGTIGLGIKPSVDVDMLQPFLLQIDFVQFMGNDLVGHSGVDLDGSVVRKIKYFHSEHPSVPIQIDIGVSESTIPELKEAGVTSFVSGSAIFGSANPKETIKKLRKF